MYMGAYIRLHERFVSFVSFCQNLTCANSQAARGVTLLEEGAHVLLLHQANEGNEESCWA
jgi:hypothetical protein